MGDMADYYLNSYACDYFEDDDDLPYERPIHYKTCSICKKPGLVWVGKIGGKWRLGDPDTRCVHECTRSK